MKAVILVGGLGTRLYPLTINRPKTMVPVLNTPFLEYVILHLSRHNFREITLAQSHLVQSIKDYFGDGRQFGVRLNYTIEDTPMGTAGAVKMTEKYLDDTFLVLNGDITAYWKGFTEYYQVGRARLKPRMMGFQAEGAAPIVRGHVVEQPETIASAIRIGNPASWHQAVAARDESGGVIDMVSDEEIMDAYHLMAAKGGIFGEPASAASLAGLLKLSRQGMDFSQKRVVCVVTGTGLKDTDIALKMAKPFLEIPADLAAVERALGWS